MQLSERLVLDPHAPPERRIRAYVSNPDEALGLTDAAGPTREEALAKAHRRYRLRWLGVEWQGMSTPDEALNPLAGQVAINGHRFALWRQLSMFNERVVLWIMLNPSTASADKDDPTMRRVCDFSLRWGYGWVTVGNLWSYRATDPAQLDQWLERGGEWVARANADSAHWVERMARRADLVVVAWGDRGDIDHRGLAMLRLLGNLGIEPHALALTHEGQPRHPLYLHKELRPRPLAELRDAMSEFTTTAPAREAAPGGRRNGSYQCR